MSDLELAKIAETAKQNAISPYYNFRVGAALVTKSGKVFTGCNIETGAGNTICAERVAFAKALLEGEREFDAIAVASDSKGFVSPCGLCRQFMHEFAKDLNVVMFDGEKTKSLSLGELLPHTFDINQSK